MFYISLRVSMTLICKPASTISLRSLSTNGVTDCLTVFCKNKHQVIHLAGSAKSGLAERRGSKDIAERTVNCELSAPWWAQLIATHLHSFHLRALRFLDSSHHLGDNFLLKLFSRWGVTVRHTLILVSFRSRQRTSYWGLHSEVSTKTAVLLIEY